MEGEGLFYQPEIDPGKLPGNSKEHPGPGLSLGKSAAEALQHELDVLKAEGRSRRELTGGYAARVHHLEKLAQEDLESHHSTSPDIDDTLTKLHGLGITDPYGVIEQE